MSDFIFIKSLKQKETKKRLKILSCVCQIALKYGGTKHNFLTDEHIHEFWEKGEIPPSTRAIYEAFNYKDFKWFIHNYVSYQDKVWNNDFLQGLLACTVKLKRGNASRFDGVRWGANDNLAKIFDASPFGGKTYQRERESNFIEYEWVTVPALELAYNEKSISFMTGVLAGGVACEKYGVDVAKYPKRVKHYFEEWRIPIEHEAGYSFFVCPIWPALFTLYMPESEKEYWLNVKKPWMAHLYAPFLWRLYVDAMFIKKGIPFLKTRRQVFYDLKKEFPDERAMKVMERLGRENDLYSLDSRIGQTVVKWSHITKPSV